MLQKLDNLQDDGSDATDSITAVTERRGPGRPKGSKNRATATARAMLAGKLGTEALLLQLRVAAGKRYKRPLKAGGFEWVVPTDDQILATGRELLRYQLPQLKATELTGADGAPLYPAPPPQDRRQLARAILFALTNAKDKMAPEDAERLTLAVRDEELCTGPIRLEEKSPEAIASAASVEEEGGVDASPGVDPALQRPAITPAVKVGHFERLGPTGAHLK